MVSRVQSSHLDHGYPLGGEDIQVRGTDTARADPGGTYPARGSAAVLEPVAGHQLELGGVTVFPVLVFTPSPKVLGAHVNTWRG